MPGLELLISGAAAIIAGTASAMASHGNHIFSKNGFMAASMPRRGGPNRQRSQHSSGIQGVHALCEVTGGGQKVYGIAIEYDCDINAASLQLDSYTTSVYPVQRRGPPGIMRPIDDESNQSTTAEPRQIRSIYTNSVPSLQYAKTNVSGRYVIAEFEHESDLSLPTRDSDKVSVVQGKSLQTLGGITYAASDKLWTNSAWRGNSVLIRGVDDWEQNHWWWDDERSAWLEYSIYLPKSFLADGGDTKQFPLVLAITHSGTSIDGTCAETLTEQCIASIWSLPEEQESHECVVITPRYERTTMNDYWEHTSDVENTHRLVESLLKNNWNYGNPNLPDRCDKVLQIDASRVYCTGWSMGAMTSLWLMAKHPQTYAAGLIIAGQQRPSDVVSLAKQKVLIITGEYDNKATPWNEKCLPVWEKAGAVVVRPSTLLDASEIFPLHNQANLTRAFEKELEKDGNITFFTFSKVDHMESARKFFYIRAAKDWLFRQVKT